MIRIPMIVAVIAAFTPIEAQAQASAVSLSSEVRVERVETGADGGSRTVLKAPATEKIVPGDRLVVTLTYANRGSEPASGFVADNPLPAAVAFDSVREDWALVSVDGGKSFGKLAALSVSEKVADGSSASRPAVPADVTHIRWAPAQPIAAGATGTLQYRGTVK